MFHKIYLGTLAATLLMGLTLARTLVVPGQAAKCPNGTSFSNDCNSCFCDPATGVSGCTLMGCGHYNIYPVVVTLPPKIESQPILSDVQRASLHQSICICSKSHAFFLSFGVQYSLNRS